MTYDKERNSILMNDVVSSGVYKIRVTITDENEFSSKEYIIELAIDETSPIVEK